MRHTNFIKIYESFIPCRILSKLKKDCIVGKRQNSVLSLYNRIWFILP